jgi:hypothetical protein
MKRPEFRGPSLKRPAMKGPSLKAPTFLADIYYDLRDRRLLPLVVLVVVAIVAAPFLLGDKSETEVVPPTASVAEEAEAAEPTSQLRVVEATPGLRDYRKRLRNRTAANPFKQQFTETAGSGESGSGAEATSSSSAGSSGANSFSEEAVTDESTTPESGGGGSGGEGDSSGQSGSPDESGGASGHLIIYDYAIDARISYSPPPGDTAAKPQEPFVEQRILPQTAIPGPKAPVATYLGPARTKDNKATGRVLLLVSGDVSQISGERRCVSFRSGGLCQLLEVEPGFPLVFAYGEGGAHYTIKVLDVELVVVGHT